MNSRSPFVPLVFLYILVTGFSACSSLSIKPDQLGPTPEVHLPMPEETRLVMRVHPERMVEMLDRAPTQEQAAVPGQLLVANFLSSSDTGKLSSLLTIGAGEKYSHHFDAIDNSRAVVFALSTRGNEGYLQNLKHANAAGSGGGAEHQFRGISWRLFVPATNARKLRSQIDEFCATPSECPDVRRISTERHYIIVDLHHDLGRPADESTLSYDDVDRSFWDDPTLAADSFLQPQGALSFYVGTENLAIWGPIFGSLEILPTLNRIAPNHRERLLARGHQFIARYLEFSSQEEPQFKDFSFVIGSEESGGIFAEHIRTFTDYGATVHGTKSASHELMTHRAERPIIAVSWTPIRQPPGEELDPPYWTTFFDEGHHKESNHIVASITQVAQRPEVQHIVELIKDEVRTRYPWAFFGGMIALNQARSLLPLSSWSQGQLWMDLRAVHANVGPANSSTEGALEGSFSLLVQRDSRWEQIMGLGVRLLERATTSKISLQARYNGDQTILEVVFGDSQPAGVATTAAAGTFEATFDLAALASLLQKMGIPGVNRDTQALQALREADRLRVQHQTLELGTATRMTLGSE